MTPSARGDGAAAGARATADGKEPEPAGAPRPLSALLVRVGGSWLCRHDLAHLSATDDAGTDVQLRP
jgi:hypothetical protein